jgi:hypothetical protein
MGRKIPMGKLNGSNPNHPKKGSRITVDPIRSDKDIKKNKTTFKRQDQRFAPFYNGN